jgi:MYXO-CTERM domain-containing protein
MSSSSIVASLIAVGLALGAPATAHAACNPTTCMAKSMTTACYTATYGCVAECLVHPPTGRSKTGVVAKPATCNPLCELIDETFGAPGAACESDGLACTTDVCGGSGGAGDGVCHHNPNPGIECSGQCVMGCCNSPNTCPPPTSGNGTASCSGVGGSCVLACNTGYKACGSACIPNAQCCTDGDCPSDPANHRHGVCGGGACSYACDTAYKPCGATCIPTSGCCANSECTSPPNGCYKTQGACNANACAYSYNDGAACNADNDACTPNDKCSSGTCVADTANAVKCVQRECHTAPVCNKTTGNCDDSAVPNSTACGGNGCTAAGTCTTGNCSSPTKDCSAKTTDCRVGICDPAISSGDNCSTTNKLNGTACSVTDKCVLAPACNGGTCVGTPKACPPSGECHVAMCNPTTGDCDDAIAPVGTACTSSVACVQNAQCDATGNCVGTAVPDGTPCEGTNCSASAACISGACTCVEGSGDGPAPTDQPDMSRGGGSGAGCAMGGHQASPSLFALLALVALIARRRRTI